MVPAAILAVAALLTLPALGPVRLNDSFWIDWVWLDQFARELANGTIYPRWLALSHDGLGSPVFYYYPPLAFYAASIFVLAGLTTYAALIATFGVGYAVSGASMYWWLKPQSEKPLIGAIAFMIAPYHSFNFYNRGALAEFIAVAILPLLMGGLWRLKEHRRGSFEVTAFSYAALICTHLPLALLASLFLIGPWLLIEFYKSRRIVPAALALALGIALAAIFWLPAIWLEPYRDAAKLWADPVLRPSNWTFWNADFRRFPAYVAVLVIGAALALPLIGLIVRQRSSWAAFGLACTLVAIGLVPAIWALPLLRSVQFPFRLLPVAEFALATATAKAAWRPATLAVALAPLLAISGFIIQSPPADQGVTLADVRVHHVDVPENLPPGRRPYSWPSRWALGIAAAHREPQLVNDVTIEPLFYFPAWKVSCSGRATPTFPDPKTQLLSHKGRNCVRAIRMTNEEKAGSLVSLLGLAALIASSLWLAKPARRRPARQMP
jgi:hypothetical protein